MIGVTGEPPAKGAVGELGFSLCCNTLFAVQSQDGSVSQRGAATGSGPAPRTERGRGSGLGMAPSRLGSGKGYHPRGDRKSAQVTEGAGFGGLPLRKRVRNCMKVQGLQGCDK